MAIVISDKIAEINCLLESRCVQTGMIALENVLWVTVIVFDCRGSSVCVKQALGASWDEWVGDHVCVWGGGYDRCIYLCLAWVTFCFRGKGGIDWFITSLLINISSTQLHCVCVWGGGLILAVYRCLFWGIDAETSAAGKSGLPQCIPRHQTRRVVKKRRPLYDIVCMCARARVCVCVHVYLFTRGHYKMGEGWPRMEEESDPRHWLLTATYI